MKRWLNMYLKFCALWSYIWLLIRYFTFIQNILFVYVICDCIIIVIYNTDWYYWIIICYSLLSVYCLRKACEYDNIMNDYCACAAARVTIEIFVLYNRIMYSWQYCYHIIIVWLFTDCTSVCWWQCIINRCH